MNSQTINYQFNIVGNIVNVLEDIKQNVRMMNDALAESTKKIGGLSNRFTEIHSFVGVLQDITGAIGGITQVGANAELQLINMKTLFGGNAEAVQEMYDRISEYGKVTPYDKAGLIDAQKTMMSFGMSGEQAFTTLKYIEPQVYSASTGAKRSIEELSSIGGCKTHYNKGCATS